MADNYLNETVLRYYHNRILTLFPSIAAFNALNQQVQGIVAEGGEPNVIETVKVNNTALTPDANKAVNIDLSGYAETSDLPTKLSDLTNDGDGSQGSAFATESYVDQNGGKIDVIKVNGTTQTITNKAVDISVPTTVAELSDASNYALAANVPTAVSDLTNDSGYQTASDVATAIGQAVASAYVYKGSVATVADLPASGNTTGDVYDVQATGINYAWNGSAWDALGQYVDTSALWAKSELVAITTAEIDALFAA